MDFDDLARGPAPQLPAEAFARRRARVAEALADDEVLVVATHREETRSRDVHFPFRPHSDFWYLTGFAEPESVISIRGDSGESTMWLRSRKPEAEIWTGRRLGVERAIDVLGVDKARDWEDAKRELATLDAQANVRPIIGHHRSLAGTLDADETDAHRLLGEMRLRKDAGEIDMLREAARIGNAAQQASWQYARAGGHEHHIEAELLATYARAGSNGPGYPPIVGSGANAAVLHYIDNRAPIAAGDLVLIDAGCEWGYYNSDITRTIPADGAWSDADRDLYEIVQDAQDAAIQTVRPGVRLREVHDAAVEVLAQGFIDQGWLAGDLESVLDDDSYRAFYMHGTSHWLGLDVHDAGAAKDADGASRTLEPGMVLTVEPGLYLNPDYARLPDGTRPLGIRIENDIVVTEDGHEDLQASLATSPDDITAIMRGA